MRIEILLKRLEDEQKKFAIEALEQPQGREAYDYGRLVGIYAGLEHAKAVLMEFVAEKDRRDFDL